MADEDLRLDDDGEDLEDVPQAGNDIIDVPPDRAFWALLSNNSYYILGSCLALLLAILFYVVYSNTVVGDQQLRNEILSLKEALSQLNDESFLGDLQLQKKIEKLLLDEILTLKKVLMKLKNDGIQLQNEIISLKENSLQLRITEDLRIIPYWYEAKVLKAEFVSGIYKYDSNDTYDVAVNKDGMIAIILTIQNIKDKSSQVLSVRYPGGHLHGYSHSGCNYSGVVVTSDHYSIVSYGHEITSQGAGGYIDIRGYIGSTTVPGNGSQQFNHPNGLAINPITGQVYVADTGNHRVQVFNSDLSYNFTIGPTNLGESWYPFDVAFDSKGSLYVADTNNSCVYKFLPGKRVSVDHMYVDQPISVAINTYGLVHVTSRHSKCITVFDANMNYINKLCDFGKVKGFKHLRGLAIDELDNVYVCTDIGLMKF